MSSSDSQDSVHSDSPSPVPSGPIYGDKRWTLGNSTELVEGAPKESRLVTAAWILIPTLLTILLLSQLGSA